MLVWDSINKKMYNLLLSFSVTSPIKFYSLNCLWQWTLNTCPINPQKCVQWTLENIKKPSKTLECDGWLSVWILIILPVWLAAGVWQLCGNCDDWWRAVHTWLIRHGGPRGLRPVATAQLPTDGRLPRLLLRCLAVVIRECQRKGNMLPFEVQKLCNYFVDW